MPRPALPLETSALPPGGRERAACAVRTTRRQAGTGLLLTGLLLGTAAAAQDGARELVRRINEHRSEPQACDGRPTEASGPLAPAPALERVRPAPGTELQAALKASGYLASRAQLVTITGPRQAQAVMALLQRRYCRLLASPGFAEIGVSREGRTWRIVFAQPLLAPDLGDWREAGRAVLEYTNAARAEPRNCGGERFGVAAPLAWNEPLAAAARAHSEDMAQQGYFGHRSPTGTNVGERATRQGYLWRRIGENIATGQGSPQQVVAGWLASPGHCRNLMDPGHTAMGAAYAVNPGSDTAIYWTQVLGAPR